MIAQACPAKDYKDKRVLLIVPDATRTCPLGMLFRGVFEQIGAATHAFDVMIALGTHQPMSEEAICERLEITVEERRAKYAQRALLQSRVGQPRGAAQHRRSHARGHPRADRRPARDGGAGEGQRARLRLRSDHHHAARSSRTRSSAFRGGNKYLFPGVSGPEVLNFFHWLGAVVTNPMIIGNKWTPVRKVVDRVGAMVTRAEALPLHGGRAGAARRAFHRHARKARGIRRASSRGSCTSPTRTTRFTPCSRCAPKMYDELWVGGEVHVQARAGGRRWRRTHHLRAAHSRDQPHARASHPADRLPLRRLFPQAVGQVQGRAVGHARAFSTHVAGIGTYEDGVEKCASR